MIWRWLLPRKYQWLVRAENLPPPSDELKEVARPMLAWLKGLSGAPKPPHFSSHDAVFTYGPAQEEAARKPVRITYTPETGLRFFDPDTPKNRIP